MRRWLWVCAVIMLMACNSYWLIRERSGHIQSIRDPWFEPDERVEVRVGGMQRFFEARHVRWMEIDPRRVYTEGTRVYYGVRLELADGSLWPDSARFDTSRIAWLHVDGVLQGYVRGDLVRVPLSQLAEMRLQENRSEDWDSAAMARDSLSARAPLALADSADTAASPAAVQADGVAPADSAR